MIKAKDKMVTLNIDGHDVKVPEGMPLIEAAAKLGIKIPHLCYCPGLKSTGACRLCLVELEGNKDLIVSCARGAKDGMIVKTNTPKVLEARRFVLDLILSNHPRNCLSCDKSGSCSLQDASYIMGIEQSSYPLKDPGYPLDSSNPFIERNYRLCILCGRCIRICKSQGANILEFMSRGMTTKVATAGDKPLQESGCDFCGSCVSVCPVAALMEKERKYRGREWQLETVKSACAYCGSGCTTVLSVINGKVVRSTGKEIQDYLCAKGRFGWSYMNHKDRLRKPFIRRNGSLTEASWGEAIDYIAKRLKEIKVSNGQDSLGGMIKATLTNEEILAFQDFFRGTIGTNNVDSSARLYSVHTQRNLIEKLGSQVIAKNKDIQSADCILVIGADVTKDYPKVGAEIKKAIRKGTKLYVIDSRKTEVGKRADLHIQPRFAFESQVLALVLKELVERKLIDSSIFDSSIPNIDSFKDYISGLDKEELLNQTNVTAESIEEILDAVSDKGKKIVLVIPGDLTDDYLIQNIRNLLILTGKLNASLVSCMLLSNLNGAFVYGGLADYLPGPKQTAKVGLTALEMINAAGTKIKGMVLFCENPLNYFPGTDLIRKKLKSLDFLVVQDVFPSELTEIADVVLPAPTFAEYSGSRINTEFEMVVQNEAIRSDIKPSWQVVFDLAKQMGKPLPYDSFTELRKVTKEIWEKVNESLKSSASAYSLTLEHSQPSPKSQNTNSHFNLVLGGTDFHFHDGHLTSRTPFNDLEDISENYVGLSIYDEEKSGLKDGSDVIVNTEKNSVACKVKILSSLPPGLLFAPRWNKKMYKLMEKCEIHKETKVPTYSIKVKINPLNSGKKGEN